MKQAIQKLRDLDVRIQESSKDYFHSRPLIDYSVINSKGNSCSVQAGLKTVLLLSAATQNNALISGTTGSGKTHLAKMVSAGLYGDAYKILQMDASFSLDKLRDIAFYVIADKEKGNLHDAVMETPLLRAPGIVIDEYNRAPNEITNIIQGWLQNGTLTFEGGREVYPGHEFDNERYQWKLATVNEGTRYSGARKLDKASRDRFGLEIPLDIFPLTDDDRRKLRTKKNANVDASDGKGALDDLLYVMKAIREIPLTSTADEFLVYLQRMNQCVKTPNNTKLEVENFSPEYCKGCHLAKDCNNICGSVYAPSDRSIIALQSMAKGLALYRHATVPSTNPEADIEDIIAVAPFALYSKMDIHPGWVDKVAKQSRWQAINTIIKQAYSRFSNFFRNNMEYIGQNTPEAKEKMQEYAKGNDAWAVELR